MQRHVVDSGWSSLLLQLSLVLALVTLKFNGNHHYYKGYDSHNDKGKSIGSELFLQIVYTLTK